MQHPTLGLRVSTFDPPETAIMISTVQQLPDTPQPDPGVEDPATMQQISEWMPAHPL